MSRSGERTPTLPRTHLDHNLSLQLSEGHELSSNVAGVDDPVLLGAGVLDDNDRPVQYGLHQGVPLCVSMDVQALQ